MKQISAFLSEEAEIMHSQETYTNHFIPSRWQSFESISTKSHLFIMSDFPKLMEKKAVIATKGMKKTQSYSGQEQANIRVVKLTIWVPLFPNNQFLSGRYHMF